MEPNCRRMSGRPLQGCWCSFTCFIWSDDEKGPIWRRMSGGPLQGCWCLFTCFLWLEHKWSPTDGGCLAGLCEAVDVYLPAFYDQRTKGAQLMEDVWLASARLLIFIYLLFMSRWQMESNWWRMSGRPLWGCWCLFTSFLWSDDKRSSTDGGCLAGLCEAVDSRGEFWSAPHGQTVSHDCPAGYNPGSEYG
jgi:hypothetical protein